MSFATARRTARNLHRVLRCNSFSKAPSHRISPLSIGYVRTLSSKNEATPASYISGSQTHFGFETVDIADKEPRVKQVFANVADSYDVMNDFMSMGIHRYWKDELVKSTGISSISKILRQQPHGKQKTKFSILDVAGGTGDVAFRFVDAAGCKDRAKSSGTDEISVTVCDINPDMLRVGEARAQSKYGSDLMGQSQALKFVVGNAQKLKESQLDDESFDLYTIAFGLRNVTDVDMALREAHRVLKPGGRYLCLEFSQVVEEKIMRPLYDAYSFNVIPEIGRLVANDRDSYQYLVESIRKFSNQVELKGRLEKAGFVNVNYTNYSGGIVAIHEGWKEL